MAEVEGGSILPTIKTAVLSNAQGFISYSFLAVTPVTSMAESTAQRGFFARLLFGQIVLHEYSDGLLVTEKNKKRQIAVSEMTQPARVDSGFLWPRLVIETGTEVFSYGGFREITLSPLANRLNIKLRPYAEKQIEPGCTDLRLVMKSIWEFLGKQYYARESHRKRLVADAKRAIAIKEHAFWGYAGSDSKKWAEHISRFIHASKEMAEKANNNFVDYEIKHFKNFFDAVEKNPLTHSQRQACVINEDRNLILAGAGTGKTSTMIGRARYLLKSNQVQPDGLLILAYGRKAAEELKVRNESLMLASGEKTAEAMNAGTPTIKTFHALGKEIIGKAEGKKPTLSKLSEDDHAFSRFIDEQLFENLKDAVYKSKVVQYFLKYLYSYRNPFDFKSMREYETYVREHEIRTLQGEQVKSFEECEIANFLLQHGVEYRYEQPYCVKTADPNFQQYKPDFFLPQYKIYIEHFALDKTGNPPDHFDQKKYLEDVEWKRKLHSLHKTKLIETYSYLKREKRLQRVLGESLQEAGVDLSRRPDEELLEELRGKGNISRLAELLRDFLKLFKESYQEWSDLYGELRSDLDFERLRSLLEIFKPIYEAYQHHLKQNREIDFADMIGKATGHVNAGRFHSSYTHILVDEFQDISKARAKLVLALLQQRPESVLFAVGDDWQSIYRFAGSDIHYIRRFEEIFGKTIITHLDKTFRCNNKICDVASPFVLRNPDQIPKSIKSDSQMSEPAVSLVRVENHENGLMLSLDAINKQMNPEKKTKLRILVLARYNVLLKKINQYQIKKDFSLLDITFMTIHAAKGKEADYVIVLGLNKKGLPSEKRTDAVLEPLLPPKEAFQFAEERRLFYVALTRARDRVYLVYTPNIASSFIKELKEEQDYPVCTTEFDESLVHPDIADIPCPKCKIGNLIPRKGKNDSTFIGCNNYPYCRYIESACLKCDGLMQRNGRFKFCVNEKCGKGITPICPNCGREMVKRRGRYGDFWGCYNYRKDSEFSCTHTEQQIIFPSNKGENRVQAET